MKFDKTQKLIIGILFIGVIFRLIISSNGNFIFNIDNARDMVDVREMVVLHKPRLIGQTTSIDGVFYGPVWYYILAVPFVLSNGNPYGSILLEILFWVIGGYYLLYLASKFYGKLATLAIGAIWVASNFILLGSQYAYNPNPILFLTPVFVYSLYQYLETKKNWYNWLTWFLAGLFLHFEVTVGLFMPIILVLSILLSNKRKILLDKTFYLGVLVFVITLLPQIVFELRHSFFMTKSLLAYHSGSHGDIQLIPDIRLKTLWSSYYDTLLPTLMNFKQFTNFIIGAFFAVLVWNFWRRKTFDFVTTVSFLLVFIPFFGLQPLKVEIMRWYLNGAMIGSIFLIGYVIKNISEIKMVGKIFSILVVVLLLLFTFNNMVGYIKDAFGQNLNESIFRNEISAIDYTYQQAGGQNFKAYTYLPSVLDWPYQYLYWWYGLKKYGYTPEDYAYAPNKPQYVNQKEKLATGKNPPDSGLTFLIKEPGRPDLQDLWMNSFKKMQLIKSANIGSITIETRKAN